MTMARISSKPSINDSRLRLLLYGGSRDDIRSIGRSSDTISPKLHKLDNNIGMEVVVGSSNGFICFLSNNHIFMWNPSTNQLHKVPQQETQKCLNGFFFSFSFDPSQDDYILFKIAREWGCWYTVEAYSLNSNSWENIGFYNLPFALNGETDPVTINGVPHWRAARYKSTPDDSSNHDVIVAFDLIDESFFDIPFPKDLSTEDKEIKMGIFDGCLTLFIQDLNSYSDCVVWVMREYGNSLSWKKEFSVSYYMGIVQPFSSTESGGADGLLVLKNSYGDLCLYDPIKDKEVEFLYNGEGSDETDDEVDFLESGNYNVACYIESKVSDTHGAVVNRKRKRSCRKEGKRTRSRSN